MKSNNKSDWLQYSGIGIQMVLTLFIFWWIGMKIGQSFEIEPWGSVFGALLGVTVSMYELWKIILKK
jgi:hypothetical protein